MKSFHLGELRGCHIIHYFAMAWEREIFRHYQLHATDSQPLATLIIEDIIAIVLDASVNDHNFISEYFNVSPTGVDPFQLFLIF